MIDPTFGCGEEINAFGNYETGLRSKVGGLKSEV